MLTLTINSQAVQLNETDCLELIDCLRNEITPQSFSPFARDYTTAAGDAVGVASDQVLLPTPAPVPAFEKTSAHRHGIGN